MASRDTTNGKLQNLQSLQSAKNGAGKSNNVLEGRGTFVPHFSR
jgi:hypothetical protein